MVQTLAHTIHVLLIQSVNSTDWVLNEFQKSKFWVEVNKNLVDDGVSKWINCDGCVFL